MANLKISPSLDLNRRHASQVFLKQSPNITPDPLAISNNALIDGDIALGDEINVAEDNAETTVIKQTFNNNDEWTNGTALGSTAWSVVIDKPVTWTNIPSVHTYEDNGTNYIATSNETITIDNANGIVTTTVTGPAYAHETLTSTGVIADGDTVTIDTKVYTFQDTLTNVDGNVHVGATAAESLANLFYAINLGAGAGTNYAADMTEHPDFDAVNLTATTLSIKGNQWGTQLNGLDTLETGANIAWGAAVTANGTGLASNGTLTFTGLPVANETWSVGGVTYTMVASIADGIPNQILIGADATECAENVVAAVNRDYSNAGTLFSIATDRNPEVRAENAAGVVTFHARYASSAGDTITLTEALTNGAVSGAVLASGAGTDNRYEGIIIVRK